MFLSGNKDINNLQGNAYPSVRKVARKLLYFGAGERTARSAGDRDFHHLALHKFTPC